MTAHSCSGATVRGEVQFEVKGGAKFSSTFNGHVPPLGRAGDARAVPLLLELLRNNPHLRPDVLQALGRLRDRRAAPLLVELLERAPKQDEFNPEADEIVNALEKIAGRGFGYNAAAWRKWAQDAADKAITAK